MRFARFESLNFLLLDETRRKRLRVAFIWKGPDDAQPRRYRESTGLDDTRENRRIWRPKLAQMERELILTNCGTAGTFDPSRWFPRVASLAPAVTRVETVGDFARRYLEELKGMPQVSELTRAQYEVLFKKHIFPAKLAEVPLAELDDGHIKIWLGELLERKLASGKTLQASTVNKILARVRTMVTVAWERRAFPRAINPMDLVENVRMKGREPNPFTPDELLAILSVCEGQQRALYITLALTALRPSEALGLFREHVDFKRGLILVRQQLRDDGTVDERLKTERSRREVKMFEPVRAALSGLAPQNWLRSKFVFANSRGGPLNERTQGDHPWRRAIARAGLEYRPLYMLRHTYTSLMLSAGKPAQWVAHQLGHVGIKKIDEVYGRWRNTPADERLELEALFQAIRMLPVRAAKSRPNLPKSSPSAEGENPEAAESA